MELSKISMENVCAVIEGALVTANSGKPLSTKVDETSSMGTPKEWDSLAFVVVYNAIAEEFGIELEDDDAIHLTSVQATHELLQEIAG
ncbi:hypothetical protein [Altererythrobacter sp. MF3-039]|uniref:hypothetical protein n=1 Tax=Altererythrobacter sp. MF3-039 TaxID=3252901 RepID=UPI00390C7711